MRFNPHYELKGKHAFMAPSNNSWLNYDEDKMQNSVFTSQAARLGTRKHEFAAEAIALRQKMPEIRKTLNLYINDAIGFKMTPEVPLYFSEWCFGTADAVSMRQDPLSGRWMLRIHDLKTGVTRTKMTQLEVYAVLFCMEYKFDPAEIDIELRIYKADDIEVYTPDLDDLMHIIDKIKTYDRIITETEKETYGD